MIHAWRTSSYCTQHPLCPAGRQQRGAARVRWPCHPRARAGCVHCAPLKGAWQRACARWLVDVAGVGCMFQAAGGGLCSQVFHVRWGGEGWSHCVHRGQTFARSLFACLLPKGPKLPATMCRHPPPRPRQEGLACTHGSCTHAIPTPPRPAQPRHILGDFDDPMNGYTFGKSDVEFFEWSLLGSHATQSGRCSHAARPLRLCPCRLLAAVHGGFTCRLCLCPSWLLAAGCCSCARCLHAAPMLQALSRGLKRACHLLSNLSISRVHKRSGQACAASAAGRASPEGHAVAGDAGRCPSVKGLSASLWSTGRSFILTALTAPCEGGAPCNSKFSCALCLQCHSAVLHAPLMTCTHGGFWQRWEQARSRAVKAALLCSSMRLHCPFPSAGNPAPAGQRIECKG